MKYIIKYTYTAGDSEGNSQYTDTLELSWENFEVAKKNLQRISEHYKMYQELTGWNRNRSVNETDFLDAHKTKDWFVFEPKIVVIYEDGRYTIIPKSAEEEFKSKGLNVKEIPSREMALYNMKLFTDDGKPFQFHCPWCGHYEHLDSIELTFESIKIEF